MIPPVQPFSPVERMVTHGSARPMPTQTALPEASDGVSLALETLPERMSEAATPRKAELRSTPFGKFLKYRTFDLEVQRGSAIETVTVGLLNGPGHDVAAVASTVLDPEGSPMVLLKTGDTRMSRVLRGDDYVLTGSVAGRLDKVGADFDKIGLAELSEEVGGVVLGDSFRRLGDHLSPTMPWESTECDACFTALVQLTGKPLGDGGGMEVQDLIGPAFFTPQDAWRQMQEGKVADAGRCQMLYDRGWDAMGYSRQLGVYLFDHPSLLERFDSLGLGAPEDPRRVAKGSEIPAPSPPGTSLESQIDNGFFSELQKVPLGQGATMLDGKSHHAVAATPVGEALPNQILSLSHDRAKVVHYAVDPERGPLVKMTLQERPVLAVRRLALASECPVANDQPDWLRYDVEDVALPRDVPAAAQLAGAEALGSPSTASAGQSDLKIHYFAREEQGGAEFIPLAEALRRCRQGHGDAQTEATLLRLADRLDWIPQLGMSVDQARRLL